LKDFILLLEIFLFALKKKKAQRKKHIIKKKKLKTKENIFTQVEKSGF
jgi:hypothetical protein